MPLSSTSDSGDAPRHDVRKALRELRRDVHAAMYRELLRRLARNPTPTREELRLGVYVEALEPQVRDALRRMREKGYTTRSSGFYAYDHAAQAIEGGFEVPPVALKELSDVDVEVQKRGSMTLIRFYPEQAEVEAIKARWDGVARALPDLGKRARATQDYVSREFRRLYRRGRLQASFLQLWIDDMGTYEGPRAPEPGLFDELGRRVPPNRG